MKIKFYYFMGPKIGLSVALPSKNSTEHGLSTVVRYVHLFASTQKSNSKLLVIL